MQVVCLSGTVPHTLCEWPHWSCLHSASLAGRSGAKDVEMLVSSAGLEETDMMGYICKRRDSCSRRRPATYQTSYKISVEPECIPLGLNYILGARWRPAVYQFKHKVSVEPEYAPLELNDSLGIDCSICQSNPNAVIESAYFVFIRNSTHSHVAKAINTAPHLLRLFGIALLLF